jgi:N-methylhydantoinase B/oxoprolinase/acetone carboxylase alpha subunit
MRAAIRRLPSGTYRAEDYLDNDGVTDRPVKIAASVTIKGDCASVDFTGSDPQVEGSVNANYAVAVSAATYVFRCLVHEDIPYTSGVVRPLEIIAPIGLVVSAQPPAAMAAGNVETSQRITDVILRALAQAAPELIPAASSGTMNNLTFGGWDSVRKHAFAYYETIAGGMGASALSDGASATHTHMTNSWNTPVEAFEHLYPLRIRAYRIRSGSGGKGKHRGGDGIVREYEFLTRADVTILSDRREHAPYGLAGGSAGTRGKNSLFLKKGLRGKRTIAIPGKARFEVQPDDVLRIESPGGGGYGKPA